MSLTNTVQTPTVARLFGYWAFPVLAMLFLLQALVRFSSAINHDAAWYIYIAKGLLDGKELYKDFVEVNPPLAILLTLPPVLAARLLDVSPITTIYVQYFVLTGATLGLVGRYVRRLPGIGEGSYWSFMVLAAIALLYAPGSDFAEREHLMVLLFLPWLFLRVARQGNWRPGTAEAVLVGLMAAIAICIKPHAATAPVLVEICIFARTKSLRNFLATENLAAISYIVLYAGAVLVWAEPFVSEIMILGVKAYVPYFGLPASITIERNVAFGVSFAFCASVLWLVPKSQRFVVMCLLAGALGFWLSFIYQAKGFQDQLLPARVLLGLALALSVVYAVDRIHRSPRVLGFTILAVAILLATAYRPQVYAYPGRVFETQIAQHRPGATSYFIASTNVSHAFPLAVNNRLTWASRYPTQWLAPYISRHWDGGSQPGDPIIEQALDSTVSDLLKFKPDIVFVATGIDQRYVKDGRFDFLAFYALDPRFSEFWKGYEKRAGTRHFDVYVRSGG